MKTETINRIIIIDLLLALFALAAILLIAPICLDLLNDFLECLNNQFYKITDRATAFYWSL